MWKPTDFFTKRNAKNDVDTTSETSLSHWIDMATADGASLDEEFGLDRQNSRMSIE
jgi:hypothetical protein